MTPGQDNSAVFKASLAMSRVPGGDALENEEEVQLVRLALGGDSKAFEQIILRHERRVMSLAMRILGTRDDAQDAGQEVFLRAFKYLHRLELGRPIEPWLIRMTVNVCRDIGRKRQRWRDTFPGTSEPEAVATTGADPFTGLAAAGDREIVWRALKTLPEKERRALVLRDVEGFSTAEVAEILGSSETTVRSQISRGRLRLKTAIDRMLGGQP